jgi:hypothetical protein
MTIDLEGVSVKSIQPIGCPKPHESLFVLENGPDRALREALFDTQCLELKRRCLSDCLEREKVEQEYDGSGSLHGAEYDEWL